MFCFNSAILRKIVGILRSAKLVLFIVLVFHVNAFATGYNATYDLNGGVLPTGNTVYNVSSNGGEIILYKPTKTGYVFTGWCAESDYTAATNTCLNRIDIDENNFIRWVVPTSLNANTTYFAVWEEDKYQISASNLSNGDSYSFGLAVTGTFYVDWGDGNIEIINKTTSGNTVYSHTYTEGGDFTIRIAGIEPNNIFCSENQSLVGSSCTACSGAECPTVKTLYACPSGYVNNVGLSACVLPTPATINYENLSGATNNNPATYVSTDLPLSLNQPTRTGYVFAGWCSSNSAVCNSLDKITEIPAGTTGNITLYATWIQDVERYCEVGQYAEFQLNVNNNTINSWCVICKVGHYCPEAVTHKFSDAVLTSNYYEYQYYQSGMILCSAAEYMPWYGHSSCISCPYGSSASDDRIYCICGENEIWNASYRICDSGVPQCQCGGGNNNSGCYAIFGGEQNGEYSYFECQNCSAGYYCPYSSFTSNMIDQKGIAGQIQCSGNTYSRTGASECTACPENSTSLADKTACQCNSGIFNIETGTCDSKIHVDAGYYVGFGNNQYIAIIERCSEGNYCPGGDYDYNDAVNGVAGRFACADEPNGANLYSEYGAASCQTCPAGQSANASHTSCQCAEGYLLNHDTMECSQYVECGAGDFAKFSYDNDYEYICASSNYNSGYMPCIAGYYCPGINPTTNEKYTYADKKLVSGDNYYVVGVEQCPTGTYSENSAVSVEDCKTCNHSGQTVNATQTGCVCAAGYILNQDTSQCVDETQISCSPSNSNTNNARFARLLNRNEQTGHYESFTCSDCQRGYACDGQPQSYLNAIQVGTLGAGVGAVMCSGNTYTSDYGQSECKTCPAGSTVDTATHATCICNNANEMFDGTSCTSGVHADPGYYVRFTNNNGNITASIDTCDWGHYCEGGDFVYADADEDGYAGRTRCPGNTYNPSGGTMKTSVAACLECPANSTANSPTPHTCICNESGYTFNRDTNSCTTSITAEPGEYMCVDWGFNGTGLYYAFNTCGCPVGYYCPGGTYTLQDMDNQHSAGKFECGTNQYSARRSSSRTACKACPTDNHGTGELFLGNNSSEYSCGCETGFSWDSAQEKCVYSCPESALSYAAYGNSGMLFSVTTVPHYNESTQSYECLNAWAVVDNVQNFSESPSDMLAAGTSIMLCKQTSEGYYLGACTRAVKMCDMTDYGAMYSAWNGGTIVELLSNVLGANNYNDLFDVSRVIDPSNGTANQTNLDIYGDEAGERCDVSGSSVSCPLVPPHYVVNGSPIPEEYSTYPYQGQFVSLPGEAFIDFDGNGLDQSDCVAGYHYGLFWYPLYGLNTNALTPSDGVAYYIKDAIAYGQSQATYDATKNLNRTSLVSGVFCRYNPTTNKYDKDCSEPVLICNQEEIMHFSDDQIALLFSTSGLMGLAAVLPGTNINSNTATWQKDLFINNNPLGADTIIPENNSCCVLGYRYVASQGSCVINEYQCNNGQYLALSTNAQNNQVLTIEQCPANYYCPAGTWTVRDINASTGSAGKIACPAGATSTAGQSDCECLGSYTWDSVNKRCSYTCESNKYLNVLDESMCVYETKPTTPALAARYNGNVYWLMMTPEQDNNYPIVQGSNTKFKIVVNNTTYNVYDGSVVSE